MFNAAPIDAENRTTTIKGKKRDREREREREKRKDERRARRNRRAGREQIRESRLERGRVREERPRARSFHCRNVVDGYRGWKKEQWRRHGEQSDNPLPSPDTTLRRR